MRIAVATEGNLVAGHFGHCSHYTLVDVVNGQPAGRLVLPNPGHEPGFLPGYLAEKKVGVVIAGGMGQRAQQLFALNGIKTVVGAVGLVDDVVREYLAGTLELGESACDHGSNGDHHHECGGEG